MQWARATMLLSVLSSAPVVAQTPRPSDVTVSPVDPSSTSPARRLQVLLPAASTQAKRRYPVLYLHDAQNLFDPKQSFSGATWQITEAGAGGVWGDCGGH
jgi:hypothetical protein